MNNSAINYSVLDGFFLQSKPSTNAADFDYTSSNFGLEERSYATDDESLADATSWERFVYYVQHLNQNSPPTVSYKVLFLARHGQGDHNVAEAKYGTAAWNDYWSKLDTYLDAHLTDQGIQQAKLASKTWKHQLTVQKTPCPETFYTSPLYRCLQTAEFTFQDPDLQLSHPFIPRVKELLREVIGIHTCDARSSLADLKTAFPNARFSFSFAETDPFWCPDVRETDDEMVARLQRLLDEVFIEDSSTWVSMTSHSGAIRALLRVIGHRPWPLETGGVMVAFVRGERVDGGTLPTGKS